MIEQSWNPAPYNVSPRTEATGDLSGRWLRLAQATWLILALIIAGMWLWSVRIWAAGATYFGNTVLDVPFGVVMPLGYFAVAVLLVVRKPGDRMAILTSLMLVFLGPYLLTGVNVTISEQAGWGLLSRLLLSLGGVLFFLFLFTFPDGYFINCWAQRLSLLLVSAYAVGMLLSSELYGGFAATFIPVTLMLGIAMQIYRYQRRSSPLQRQQTKWVVMGAVGPVLVVLNWVLLLVPGVYAPPSEPLLFIAHQSMTAALALLLPVALTFSILRHRLWNIDLIISRTLVYGMLTAVIVALYALVVGGIAALFQTQANWLLALIATGIVAVIFQPLRDHLQRGVNRLLYGQRDEPFEVLAQLGQRLENAFEPDRVLPTMIETIAHSLKLPYVAIAIQQGDSFQIAESHGKSTGALRIYPLTYQGTVIGQLQVAQRSPHETFIVQEERLLQNIARQAGTSVHALQLTADLQYARQQVVASREEERRRLRRDLHDGLGPSLAAQLLKLGSARTLLADRPEVTAQLLTEMETDIEGTLAEVRRIVYDLRPPALDQWGLAGALRTFAETCESEVLAVRVETPQVLPPLPAAVEVAAYHIGREALTNVVRHAQARRTTLRLAVENEKLHLTILDDGRGIAATPHAGVGLTAMRERAKELGGTLAIHGKPGHGTQVTALLPLNSSEGRSTGHGQ